MPDFTQRVQTSEGCFDISFRRAADESTEYLVTVIEDDYAAPPFAMRFINGCWKIHNVAGVSLWVRQLEEVLQKTLLQNCSGKIES